MAEKFKSFLSNNGLWLIIALHTVGILGVTTIAFEFFVMLTPLVLLLSSVLLILCHQSQKQNIWIFFGICFVLGYVAELIGTQTGFLFGNYYYGKALGPSVAGVPLVIGVNWFLLSMGSAYMIKNLFNNRFLQVLFAALVMVFLDIWIEPVAQVLDYWQWKTPYVPLMNYLGWFVTSVLMQVAFQFTIVKEHNSLASGYFFVVLMFFIILNFTL